MEQVRDLLQERVAQLQEPLGPLLEHLLLGGKQLRPGLVLLIGDLFAAPAAPFQQLAAAVEMLHTATLLHDDVVDQSRLRRGRETLHTIWPTGAAVLAGDCLLGQATLLVAELQDPNVFRSFGQLLCTMCAGEIRQTLVTRGKHASREDYRRSIEAKTASFFVALAGMAGLLAAADEQQVAALRLFGRELGLAYQIVDDVLDFVGDENQLGKPAGSDLRQGLITLPLLCHLEMVPEDDPVRDLVAGRVQVRMDEEKVQAALEAVRTSGALPAALCEAQAHAERAQQALQVLPDNRARHTLRSLAAYVVDRSR
jgi:geranylgeranyl pyrophosphate synthase